MSTEFTAQQLQILEKEGVPADYDEMTDMQKEFLERADKMMTYLYDKYNEYGVSFVYDGYHPAEMFEGEWMIAYPESGDPELDKVTVERVKGNEDVFEDNYLDVATRPYWEEILNDYFSEYFDSKYYRIYVRSALVKSMEVNELPELSKKYIKNGGELSGKAYIFISKEVCTPDEFGKFTKEYHAWLQEHQFYGIQSEFLYTQEGVEQLTSYDTSKNRDEYAIACVRAYIHENKINGGDVSLLK